MPIKTLPSQTKTILFYDGTCAFCHGVVRFVLSRDKYDLLRFSPLQGETNKKKNIDAKGMKSIILLTPDGKTYYKSDAAIALGELLGGIWSVLAKIVKVIPTKLRDILYDLIANIRYKLAGKIEDETCPVLPKNYQSKILL